MIATSAPAPTMSPQDTEGNAHAATIPVLTYDREGIDAALAGLRP